MTDPLILTRQKNGIDALTRATGWRWEGDGLSFDGYDAQGQKIASVLTAGLDGNSIGALVNCRGRIYSKTGSFEVVLKFLKSKAFSGETPWLLKNSSAKCSRFRGMGISTQE